MAADAARNLSTQMSKTAIGLTILVSLAFLGLAANASARTARAQTHAASRSNACGGSAAARDYWKPDGRAGDLEFNVPGGWRQIEESGQTALLPAGLQPGQITRIGFSPPQTLAGNLRSYFEALWARWRTQFNTIDNDEPETTHNPNGFEVLHRYSRIYRPAMGGYPEIQGTFTMAVAQMGNRVEAYWFIDNTSNLDYEEAFRDFQNDVHFANQAAPELPEPGVPCGLDGIYVGWKKTAGLRNGIIAEGLLKVEVLVFFPDGNVLRHLPERGLENFDFGVELKQSRNACGRYRMVGDQFRITWSDNTSQTANREGKDLHFEGGWTYQPAAKSDGVALNGTYRTDWAQAGPVIRFTPDGQFVENGILDSVDYHGTDKRRGNGTYAIRKNTLDLRYADGRTIPLSFYIFASDEAGQRPKLIHLNSYAFVLAQ